MQIIITDALNRPDFFFVFVSLFFFWGGVAELGGFEDIFVGLSVTYIDDWSNQFIVQPYIGCLKVFPNLFSQNAFNIHVSSLQVNISSKCL